MIDKLFKSYYAECSISKPSFVHKAEYASLQTGVLAGLSSSKISFKGTNTPYLTNASFSAPYNITAGVFLNIIFPRTQKYCLYIMN